MFRTVNLDPIVAAVAQGLTDGARLGPLAFAGSTTADHLELITPIRSLSIQHKLNKWRKHEELLSMFAVHRRFREQRPGSIGADNIQSEDSASCAEVLPEVSQR